MPDHESKNDFDLTVLNYSSIGTVNILLDGKEYIYFIDAAYIPLFLKRSEKSGGRAFNYLKEKSRDCRCLGKMEKDGISG